MDSIRPYAQGCVAALSTGEGWLLSDQQWQDIVALTVRHADGMPVWAGALRTGTDDVIALTRRARLLGADAIVVTAPFTPGSTDQQIYEHVSAVAAVGLPVVMYDETELAGRASGMDTLRRISELPGVIAVKESRSDPDEALAVVMSLDIPVFVGREEYLTLGAGAAGAIVGLANLEPALCRDVLDRPDRHSQHEIDRTCARLGLYEDQWYRQVKAELARRGVIATDGAVSRACTPSLVPGGRDDNQVDLGM
jgi:4-hydroxy-tetrahydrodipicolinate synthase